MTEPLPPVGWADVATKHDLDGLRASIALVFEAGDEPIERRFAQIEAHVSRTVMTWLLAGMGVRTAVIGLAVGLT